MANVCCDDVYFYSLENHEGLRALWEDLEASVILCTNPDLSWIGNLFLYKDINTDGIGLRGNVCYMEYNDGYILLEAETAWSPLYDAYQAIANAYGINFVMESIEPGNEIYYCTDNDGLYFRDRYSLSINDDTLILPTGKVLSECLENGQTFDSEETLLSCFASLGYPTDSLDNLTAALEDSDIFIHEFENPYS